MLPGLLFLMLFASCTPAAPGVTSPPEGKAAEPLPTLELIGGSERLRLDIPTLAKKIEAVQFKVFNPEWKKEIEYRAFPLGEVLRLAGIELDGSEGDIVFHCADGYTSVRQIKLLSGMEPMLAFEEVGPEKWTALPGRDDKVLAGPFYVLTNRASDFDVFPWPYQVQAIELIDFEGRYAALVPTGAAEDSAELRGFRAFRSQNCLSCHSLNLVGGTVGPELNVPKNITEYRDDNFLKAWIRDPSAFRARTLMPPNPAITDAQLDDILAYLSVMKHHKTETAKASVALEE